jgi:hypothetical protein
MQKRPDVQNIGADRIQEGTVVTGDVTTHSLKRQWPPTLSNVSAPTTHSQPSLNVILKRHLQKLFSNGIIRHSPTSLNVIFKRH